MKNRLITRLNKIQQIVDAGPSTEKYEVSREAILERTQPWELSLHEKVKLDNHAKENGLLWDEVLQKFYPGVYTTEEEIACQRAFKKQYDYPIIAKTSEERSEHYKAEVMAYSEFQKQYFIGAAL